MADYPKFKFNNSGLPYWPPGLSKEFEEYAKRMQATLIPDPEDLRPRMSYEKFIEIMRTRRNTNIPYCGNCCFRAPECSDGFGYCNLVEHSTHCCDQCELDHTKMKPRQIAKALHHIQKWRRGAKVPMPSPYVIGKVNDAAIYRLRNQERERREFEKKWQELEDAARVRRGDLVLIRGEYKGIVASIKVINGSYLIEFEHRTNGRVNRFLALPEDVKILFRKY